MADVDFDLIDVADDGPVDCGAVNSAQINPNAAAADGYALIYDSSSGYMAFRNDFITGTTEQTLTGNWVATGTTAFQPGNHQFTQIEFFSQGVAGPIGATTTVSVPVNFPSAFASAPRVWVQIVSNAVGDNDLVTTVGAVSTTAVPVRVRNNGGAPTTGTLTLSVLAIV